MQDSDLIEILKKSIKEDGAQDNGFLQIIKNIFSTAVDVSKPNFLQPIDKKKMDLFYEFYSHDDLPEFDDEDYKAMVVADYWNNPKDLQEFIYEIKALPLIRERYPRLYDVIVTDNSIYPPGLDEQSKKNPDLHTIWNEVEKAEKGKYTKGASGGGFGTKFKNMSYQDRRKLVQNNLSQMVDSGDLDKNVADQVKNSDASLKAIIAFLQKFLR